MKRQLAIAIVAFLTALLVGAANVTWSAQADLAARIETIDGRASAIEGRALSIDAAVLSNGPDLATNVELEISVTADPPLASAPALLGITSVLGSWTCSATLPYVCSLRDDLASSLAAPAVRLTIQAPDSPVIGASRLLSISVRARSTTADPAPANNSAIQTVRVVDVSQAVDLRVQMSAPSRVEAGETIIYAVTATNLGNRAASSLALEHFISAGRLISANIPAPGTCRAVAGCSAPACSNVPPSAPGFVCDYPASLLSGGAVTAHISIAAPDASTLRATALVSSPEPDLDTANNSVSTETTIDDSLFLSIGGSSGGSGCVIKAAYGNSLAPELDSLRWFRDRWLLRSPIGRAIVKYYYAVSPVIADWIAHRPAVRASMRAFLWPIVFTIRDPLPVLVMLLGMVLFALHRDGRARRRITCRSRMACAWFPLTGIKVRAAIRSSL